MGNDIEFKSKIKQKDINQNRVLLGLNPMFAGMVLLILISIPVFVLVFIHKTNDIYNRLSEMSKVQNNIIESNKVMVKNHDELTGILFGMDEK